MKLEDLAERAMLSVGTVSQIETGKQGYSRESLEAIAKALETRPGFLLELDPNIPNQKFVIKSDRGVKISFFWLEI
jgi:transcriptional regulator with XRE-family HTH domain